MVVVLWFGVIRDFILRNVHDKDYMWFGCSFIGSVTIMCQQMASFILIYLLFIVVNDDV